MLYCSCHNNIGIIACAKYVYPPAVYVSNDSHLNYFKISWNLLAHIEWHHQVNIGYLI